MYSVTRYIIFFFSFLLIFDFYSSPICYQHLNAIFIWFHKPLEQAFEPFWFENVFIQVFDD